MAKNYTAVIFFHGVGDPQRNVSLSSFLDHFDLFGQTQIDTPIGSAQRFKYRSSAKDNGQIINYVEISNIRKRADGTGFVNKRVRLYEAYWVPEAGARYTTIYLLGWLLTRIVNPIKLVFSRWRSYHGVRLWSLIYMSSKPGANQGRFQDLERAYHDFDAWEHRRKYRNGTFKQFKLYISERYGNLGTHDSIMKILDEWRSAFRNFNFKLLTKFTFYVGVFCAFILVSLWSYIQWILDLYASGIFGLLTRYALVATISTLVIFRGWMALRRHAIDVLTWTLESEKDERIKARDRVVGLGRNMIRDVVDDEQCDDCVLVGHSLGSCIALEALLMEGQYIRAKGLDTGATSIDDSILKVRDVFTVGSPIDRIFHFFASDRTFSHRYNRISEEQRLTVNLPPFWNLSQAGTARITNFWCRFDPISSELNSIRKKVADRSDAVRNIECLPPGVPLPISSHISYFSDQSVMGRIYKSVMTGGEVSPVEATHPPTPLKFITFSLFAGPALLAMFLILLLLRQDLGAILTFVLLVVITTIGLLSTIRLKNHHKMHSGPYLTR